MKVKKYKASTMAEIMKKIRTELGSDAVILNSREIQEGGFLGMFKKQQFEVVAAIDPQPLENKPSQKVPEIKIKPTDIKQQNNQSDVAVLDEIKYLKKILEQQSSQSNNRFTSNYQPVFQHLLDQEVEKSLASEIISSVLEKHNVLDRSISSKEIVQDTKAEIEKRLSEVSFQGISYKQKVVHFIGPTGVGKTTTLAKIAANSILKDNKKVALITADTYRIAAIDQLKTYAQILNAPIEVAYTAKDYQQAIKKFEDYDLILVDTAGRNYRDEKYIEELTRSLNFDIDFNTYLVLSLTAKPKDVADIYKQFSHLPINNVIFTKFDETRQYGSILNIALNNSVSVAYLTNGQDVPDDLIYPTAEKISMYIMGGFFDE